MNEVVRTNQGPFWELYRDELKRWGEATTDKIKLSLVEDIRNAGRLWLIIAAKLRILIDRSEDLAPLRRSLGAYFHYVRLIAEGKLLPDVLVRFAAKRSLLKMVSAFPEDEQMKCIADGGVEVAFLQNGTFTHRRRDLAELPAPLVRQVLAADHVRKSDEQNVWLSDLANVQANFVDPIHKARPAVAIDGKRLCAVVAASAQDTALTLRTLEVLVKQLKELRAKGKSR